VQRDDLHRRTEHRAPQKLKLQASLDVAWDYVSAHIASLASRYPRTLAASVSVGLAGFAATAFGVAPPLPDAADLPRRTIVENVAPADLHAQLDVLAEHELDLFRSELTRPSDTADSLLARLNVADLGAASFLRLDSIARRLLEGRAGKRVQVRVDARGRLIELLARFAAPGNDKLPTQFTRLRIQRIADKLVADITTAPLSSQTMMASGTIRSTLFGATDDAGIPDAVASQLAEIFANDIDFRRELRLEDEAVIAWCELTRIGTSSVTLREGVRAEAGWVAAEAEAVVVAWNRETGGSRPLSDAERAALERALAPS
jgi:hypothetical protein